MHFSVVFISFCMNDFNDLYDYEIYLCFSIPMLLAKYAYIKEISVERKVGCSFSSGSESGERTRTSLQNYKAKKKKGYVGLIHTFIQLIIFTAMLKIHFFYFLSPVIYMYMAIRDNSLRIL